MRLSHEPAGLIKSPELAAFLNAIPFPFGIGYAWRRMWNSCLTSFLIRSVAAIAGVLVGAFIAFTSAYPDGSEIGAAAWILIVGFAVSPLIAILALNSWDIYRRLNETDRDAQVSPFALLLVLLTVLLFTPIIYNGFN